MRLLIALTCLAAVGCKMDNPAFGVETEGDSASGTTSDASTTSASSVGTTTTTATASASDSAGTTTGPTTGPDVTGPGTTAVDTGTSGVGSTSGTGGSSGGVITTSTGTTGGVALCPDQFIDAGTVLVEHLEQGSPIEYCGETKTFTGPVNVSNGIWSVSECGGDPDTCGCDGPTNDIKFTVPEQWPWTAPPQVSCAIVTVRWNSACEFDYAVVNAMEQNVIDPVPIWIGNGVGAGPNLLKGSVVPVLTEGCDCEMMGCCPMDPGEYSLKFNGFSWPNGPYLYPGNEVDGTYEGKSVTLANAASHQEPTCGMTPHMSWIVKRNL